MGSRERENAVRFRQSIIDFPLTVSLGKKNPTWRLSRWGKSGLRFVPSDEEGFILRGDKQRLLYNGRRRSHRFTILGDTAFEYDCVLEREPESNIISLRMEGAEKFDFLRQPDFLKEPLLAGSYAIYKKETLIGEGTGKLCHIHRPEIIDARGRRCWGDLSIIGNELQMTIPEWWLGEAKYPVVVDPTIGTTTVGSQYIYWNEDSEIYEALMFELKIPVNQFLVPETINGLCTAYFYVNSDDWEAGGHPVIYSDYENKPLTRKSTNEGFIDLRVVSGKPAGWRSATFSSNGSIASGSNIWFGVYCEYNWMPRFDWGSRCYSNWWWERSEWGVIPDTYPNYSFNLYDDYRLSMYFTYSSAQNFVRTLTQGVNLPDNRKLTGIYKRSVTHTAEIESIAKNSWILIIKIMDSVHAVSNMFRSLTLFVCIFTQVFIRDYLLRRFLVAREELVLKSVICREIVLDSRVD